MGRNQTWLALLRSAKAAAGVTRIASVRGVKVFKDLPEELSEAFCHDFGLIFIDFQ